ncbi:MAG TPA: helix-turn-helix transcriptional regulator [Azospirillum sp.]
MTDDKNNVITPAQCRAARALVRMNQQKLAKAAEVSTKTIADFEREIERQLNIRTLRAIRAALEAVGVELIAENGGGEGVRFKKAKGTDADVI